MATIELAQALSETLADFPQSEVTADTYGRWLTILQEHGLDRLPRPGQGHTLARWQALAAVAACDLSLVKLYEGHTDALAILAELGGPRLAKARWGVWAAEPPYARLRATGNASQGFRAQGRKAWCSGAAVLTHALVTAWDEDQRPQLLAVDLSHPGVTITADGWRAVGMGGSASVEVEFDEVPATAVGDSGAYLSRPGFWHGGGGIAACWYGAARQLGLALHQHCQRREEPHAMAHLGAVDTALGGAAAMLAATARQIDQAPGDPAQYPVRRVRAAVEACAQQVIEHVGRALGAGPYCRDAAFARRIADLPVFLRQSHAERDLAELAALTLKETSPWTL